MCVCACEFFFFFAFCLYVADVGTKNVLARRGKARRNIQSRARVGIWRRWKLNHIIDQNSNDLLTKRKIHAMAGFSDDRGRSPSAGGGV